MTLDLPTVLAALAALLGVGALLGGAAFARLLRPPTPIRRPPPGPSTHEKALAEEERVKVHDALERRRAAHEHIDEIAKLSPDEATRARAAERERRRGGP